MSPPPRVSVIVPVFNGATTLAAALDAILNQRAAPPLEAIVVDDGSTDASPHIARSYLSDGRVQLLQRPNGGEAAALNTGWRAARGALIAIVEADVILEPDWLATLSTELELHDDAIAAGGHLLTDTSGTWISRLAGYEVEHKLASQPRQALHLTSANVLYRREAWELAGPFDEHLVNASLDAAFNARLRSAGSTLLYEPRARARHRYKDQLLGFLARHYAYARYRLSGTLYPADTWVALHVIATALTALATLAGAALLSLHNPLALTLLPACLIAPALHIPRALAWLRAHRDPAALLWPLAAWLRNLVALPALALALIRPASPRG